MADETDAEAGRRFLAQVLAAQEEERRRLATEIHGDTIQVVSTAALQLGMLRVALDDSADPATLSQLHDAEASVQEAAARLRTITAALLAPALGAEGLAAALRLRLELLRAATAVEYELDVRLTAELAPGVAALLGRVAEEALANVARHARASRVRVNVGEEGGGVSFCVADDGVGLPPDDERRFVPGQMGLVVLRERVGSAGGRVHMEGGPGHGVTLEVWLPSHAQPADGRSA